MPTGSAAAAGNCGTSERAQSAAGRP